MRAEANKWGTMGGADLGLARVHVGCALRFLLSVAPRLAVVVVADAQPEGGREGGQQHLVKEE